MPTVAIRPATAADLDLIAAQRRAIFLEAGHAEALVDRFEAGSRAWHEARLADGRYLGWIAEAGGASIGGAGLSFLDWSPGPSHPQESRRGLVLNVWVKPDHRGRGVGKALMREVERGAKARGVSFLVLHSSELGRPLYERLGYAPTSEMSRRLEAA